MTAAPAQPRAILAAAAFDIDVSLPNDTLRHDTVRAPATVGPITLRPHQRSAVLRVRRLLATYRGALLADAVGLGKTWVALTLLADAQTPLVVAPAALRPMWRRVAASAGVRLQVVTIESLSAPAAPTLPAADLLVVDEAHHFRTPGTRRRARLAAACATTPALLLTATPVHNATRDLTALLALFLGEPAAATLDPATLAHLVVRRRHRDVAATRPDGGSASLAPALPTVARTRWHRTPATPAVLHALLALPPPVPLADGGHAPALDTLALVRLWASSDAALRAGLRRRLARAAALAHALDAGRLPDRHTLARYAAADDALQLPLPWEADPHAPNVVALRRAVDAYGAALRAARACLDGAPSADPARVAWLRALRTRHPGARVVAFTQFADTARALFRALAPGGHVGLLTAAGGRIASGPIARDALLARFAPRGAGAPDPPAIQRVDCLVSTDCVSEGLDLHDASVVVHLDLPWTPARLAQRVGRAARLGSAHATVYVYGLRPPAAAAAWLRLARRLRAKARAAGRALGEHPAPNGRAADGGRAARDLARHLALRRMLERWLVDEAAGVPPGGPADAATAAPAAGTGTPAGPPPGAHADAPAYLGARRTAAGGMLLGTSPASPGGRTDFVAVWHPGGRGPTALVAALGGRPPTGAPRTVARALRRLARGGAVPPPNARAGPDRDAEFAARAAVRAWGARRAARAAVGHTGEPALDPAPTSHARRLRAALARADSALRAAPPHARSERAAEVATRRAALAGRTTGGDGDDAQTPPGRVTALVFLPPR